VLTLQTAFWPGPASEPVPTAVVSRLMFPDGGPVQFAGLIRNRMALATMAGSAGAGRARSARWLSSRGAGRAVIEDSLATPGRGWGLREANPGTRHAWSFMATLLLPGPPDLDDEGREWLDPDEARARAWDLLWPLGTGLARLGRSEEHTSELQSLS